MRVAVVGATGLVGQEMLRVLAEFQFPVSELVPVASAQSKGKLVHFQGIDYPVITIEDALTLPANRKIDIALFSAGGDTSKQWAPAFAAQGTVVIDNSSAWRMDPNVPLVVPEVNMTAIGSSKIIANPNCSTIQLVVALKPLHDAFGLRRVVVSTYQSVTGTGKKAVDQLNAERDGQSEYSRVYPHAIDLNIIPHIDVFLDNGYTKEEMKVVNETRKIMGISDLPITCTAVRIPVVGGHSESVNIEFERHVSPDEAREVLAAAPGIIIQDDPAHNHYPMPRTSHGRNEVFVGRIRKDESIANGLNIWVVADNLRKGAATNAVQIAQALRQSVIA